MSAHTSSYQLMPAHINSYQLSADREGNDWRASNCGQLPNVAEEMAKSDCVWPSVRVDEQNWWTVLMKRIDEQNWWTAFHRSKTRISQIKLLIPNICRLYASSLESSHWRVSSGEYIVCTTYFRTRNAIELFKINWHSERKRERLPPPSSNNSLSLSSGVNAPIYGSNSSVSAQHQLKLALSSCYQAVKCMVNTSSRTHTLSLSLWLITSYSN